MPVPSRPQEWVKRMEMVRLKLRQGLLEFDTAVTTIHRAEKKGTGISRDKLCIQCLLATLG